MPIVLDSPWLLLREAQTVLWLYSIPSSPLAKCPFTTIRLPYPKDYKSMGSIRLMAFRPTVAASAQPWVYPQPQPWSYLRQSISAGCWMMLGFWQQMYLQCSRRGTRIRLEWLLAWTRLIILMQPELESLPFILRAPLRLRTLHLLVIRRSRFLGTAPCCSACGRDEVSSAQMKQDYKQSASFSGENEMRAHLPR